MPSRGAALSAIVRLIPSDFFHKATVSNLASNFDTVVGRVFLACILLSSLALLTSEFPFWRALGFGFGLGSRSWLGTRP